MALDDVQPSAAENTQRLTGRRSHIGCIAFKHVRIHAHRLNAYVLRLISANTLLKLGLQFLCDDRSKSGIGPLQRLTRPIVRQRPMQAE